MARASRPRYVMAKMAASEYIPRLPWTAPGSSWPSCPREYSTEHGPNSAKPREDVITNHLKHFHPRAMPHGLPFGSAFQCRFQEFQALIVVLVELGNLTAGRFDSNATGSVVGGSQGA